MMDTGAQVTKQLIAMRAELFELLLFTYTPGGVSNPVLLADLSLTQVMARLPWLKAQNTKGANINIRPSGTHLTLLDDVTLSQVAALDRQGYEPCVVVQTSPRNYQAWLDHGRELELEEATEFARQLARIAGADLGAAGRRHAGRLAGFTNRKPVHCKPTGQFPFVTLDYAMSRTFTKSPSLRMPAPIPAPVISFHRGSRSATKTIEDFHNNSRYDGDYSRADYAFAIYAHSHGLSEAEIVSAILTRDLSKKGNVTAQERYARYTCRRAARSANPASSLGSSLELPRR